MKKALVILMLVLTSLGALVPAASATDFIVGYCGEGEAWVDCPWSWMTGYILLLMSRLGYTGAFAGGGIEVDEGGA